MELTPSKLTYLDQAIPGIKVFFLYKDGQLSFYPLISAVPKVLGCSLAEAKAFLCQDPLGFIYPEDRPLILQALAEGRYKKGELSLYARLLHKDGSFSWAQAVSRYLGTMEGADVFVTSYNSALNQKDAYSEVLDGTRRRVYICDYKNKEVIYLNRAAQLVSGVGVLGKKCFECLYQRDCPCPTCRLDQLT